MGTFRDQSIASPPEHPLTPADTGTVARQPAAGLELRRADTDQQGPNHRREETAPSRYALRHPGRLESAALRRFTEQTSSKFRLLLKRFQTLYSCAAHASKRHPLRTLQRLPCHRPGRSRHSPSANSATVRSAHPSASAPHIDLRAKLKRHRPARPRYSAPRRAAAGDMQRPLTGMKPASRLVKSLASRHGALPLSPGQRPGGEIGGIRVQDLDIRTAACGCVSTRNRSAL